MDLEFERLSTNTAMEVWRVAVPGGWLVQGYLEAGHMNSYDHVEFNHQDYHVGICFIPDPQHTWGKKA